MLQRNRFPPETLRRFGPDQKGIVANNDSGVILERDPDTVRVPDLVVEVMSPSDVFTRVMPKVQ